MIRVGVCGASGYTAEELLRILLLHPKLAVTQIVSHSQVGKRLSDLYPHFGKKAENLILKSAADVKWNECDCVFFATPAGIAMREIAKISLGKVKVIDLSADFRIKDVDVWEKWYRMKHTEIKLLQKAVYGLPEARRKQIAKADLIANPGCYATSVQLALLPLLASKEFNAEFDGREIVVDAKSGTSGAGRKSELHLSLSERSEDFTCYAVEGHRHQPEMECHLDDLFGANWNSPLKLRFTPHLLPVARGIFSNVYLPLGKKDAAKLSRLYLDFYAREPFVQVLPEGAAPRIKSVRGSNGCQLAIFSPPQSDYIIVCSVLDNLVKGAAGQAVQNLNILFDLEETTGLQQIALMP